MTRYLLGPVLVAAAGLTTLATHQTPGVVTPSVATPEGKHRAVPRAARGVRRVPLPEPPRRHKNRKPHPPSVAPVPAGSGTRWDGVAACESSGNWQDTDGMFEGGLQFLNSTWLAYGGGEYAAHAYDATKAQQIEIAERVLAGAGIGSWPTCGRYLEAS